MKRRIRTAWLVACSFAFALAAFLLPASASAAGSGNAETVKVGVLNDTSYAYQDENGTWRGSDVECMIDIAQKAGFNVEFVDSTTDVDLFEHLDDGTYDVLADMAQGVDFKDNYLFTDETISTVLSTIGVRADDNRWDYGDIDQLSQMKIGVIAGYVTNADFRTWCEEHNVTPEILEYPDIKVMSKALEDGEIDGELYLAADGEEYTEQFHTILRLLPEPCYFMFRKDDVGLKNKVDAALAQILAGNADYLSNLRNKYEAQFNDSILPLSSDERAYISEHPAIGVAVVSDDSPYYLEDSNGTGTGIIPDYYALLAGWTGATFRYDVYGTYDEAIAAVIDGKSDVVGIFSNGLVSAYQDGLSVSDAISNASCILLTNSSTDISAIKTIAVATKTLDALEISVGKLYPNATVIGYASAQDCFDAVAKKDVDATILGTQSATWIMNQTNSTAYNVVPVAGAAFDECIAVRSDNQMLCSILNKGIAATKGSYTGIATKDTMSQNDWRAAISRIPPGITVLVACILMALVIGLAWALVKLSRRQKERAAIFEARAEAEQQRIRAEASEKSAEEKNAFFSNISHDMRTPLNAVIGFADLGEGVADADEKDGYFEKIKTSGKLLNSLIDDTLTISKISSGKLRLVLQPAKTSEMFEEIVDSIRQVASAKNITFSADTSQNLDRVILVDRINMQKIVLNLLSNAIKYTPEGGHVTLRIYNDPPDSANPDSFLQVIDDGIGISEEFLPHVFEPFTQEKRHGYESVGTGLGLSIVKQLVELMGGTIDVSSKKDVGTTFTVRLHFQEADSQNMGRQAVTSEDTVDLSGKKVLLCEDNALNREIAVALLRHEGLEVVSVEDGSEGVHRFIESAEGEYSAVLMDIRMPVMDGYEATRKIRELDRGDAKTVPIIAMTADAFADDVSKCFDAGMNGHIAKPVDPQKVHATLVSLIA